MAASMKAFPGSTRFASDTEGERRRTRVAWIHPVVAHYRVPVINRLARSEHVELHIFGGQPLAGTSVPDASETVSAPFTRLHNVYLSQSDDRVLMVTGLSRLFRWRPDVIIANEASHNTLTWLLLLLRRIFGYKLVVMGHIRLAASQRSLGAALRRFIVTRADGVLAYSTAGAQVARGWGTDEDTTVALGNTLDTDAIAQARARVRPEHANATRAALGLAGTVCLFVARPTPPKRLDVAIDTMRLLANDAQRETHLLVIGDGADLAAYREQAAGLSNVHFLGEVLDEAELATYFAVSDIVMIPGAVGLAVNHAFAYGLPILTSVNAPHGPEMELALEGRNALLMPDQRSETFAEAIRRLAENDDELAALKAAADATPIPTADGMADAIADLVRRVSSRSA